MTKPELRGEARLPITKRAKVTIGDTTIPCMVMDMSSTGFLLMCSRPLPVGWVLGFRCELEADSILECKIEIKHSTGEDAGARIVEIDDRCAKMYQLYLQNHFSDKLSRSR